VKNEVYKVAIIGLGMIGCRYFEAIQDIDHVEVMMGVENDKEKAKWFADKYGMQVYSPDEFWDVSNMVDGVIITVPNVYHASYIARAIECNLDILSEKPLTTSIEDAQTVLEMAKKKQHFLYLALHTRFRSEVQYALKYLSGQIKNIELYYCENWIDAPIWYKTPSICGGGVTLDVGVNQFDWITDILNIEEITGVKLQTQENGTDISNEITWRHSDGIGKMQIGWNSKQEKKFTKVETLDKRQYILDHVKHTVTRDGELIWEGQCDEYKEVFKDYMLQMKKGNGANAQKIIHVMQLIADIYKESGLDYLSSSYSTL